MTWRGVNIRPVIDPEQGCGGLAFDEDLATYFYRASSTRLGLVD